MDYLCVTIDMTESDMTQTLENHLAGWSFGNVSHVRVPDGHLLEFPWLGIKF